jgi:RHS repeat-associated protein
MMSGSISKLTASSGSLANPFQDTARESDPGTDLYYYRARYYDPTAGRLLSEDRMGFASAIDFYTYVRNNPTSFIDPSGLQAVGPPADSHPLPSPLCSSV